MLLLLTWDAAAVAVAEVLYIERPFRSRANDGGNVVLVAMVVVVVVMMSVVVEKMIMVVVVVT
jgi:hypothetical protein